MPISRTAIPLLGLAALALATIPAHAQLTSYATRADFNAAFSGLPVETFEAANVGPGTITGIPSPLDNTTSNTVFTTGSIQDGLRIADTGADSGDSKALAVTGAGATTYASKAVYDNFYSDGLTLTFYNNGGVQAVGLDLISYVTAATQTVPDYRGATVLGLYPPTVSAKGTFFGVSSGGAPITSLSIAGDDSHTRGVDNIAFGGAAPEPATWLPFAFTGLAAATLILKAKRRNA